MGFALPHLIVKRDLMPMNCVDRRTFLLTIATVPFALGVPTKAAESAGAASPQARLAMLERTSGGRLGVCAVNTANGAQIRHRAGERFPFCSTFKVILAGAILARSVQSENLLQQRIHYTRDDLVCYSPVSEKHLSDGMTVSELCAAALQYSDNTSANLLMKILGGPPAVTTYARSIGNSEFRLDRWETELNASIPGDPRDTATPDAMAASLRALALGDALPPARRKLLNKWLCGNTTGAKRIRAATPAGWQVGDKTGSGDYGTTNDIAVLWPPERKPIVLAIYYTRDEPGAKWHTEVIVAAARIVVESFSQAQAVN